MRKLNTIILGLCLLAASTMSAFANVVSLAPPEYLHWLDGLKTDMADRGISAQTIDAVFSQDFYHPNPEVVKIDRRQIEFALTSTAYINRVVNAKRVELGRKNYHQLLPVLKPIAEQYGVPAHYLVAFWGVETNFGSNFGGYNTIAALVSLSYDQRRPEFFKNELYQALKIIDTWKIGYTQMQGSWAGAMGHFQFMPSTFNAYAVDFNGDETIDIWRSFEDAAASAANYLHSIGWKADQPWGMQVSLPWNFDFALAGRAHKRTIAEWNKLGIKTIGNKKLPLDSALSAAIILPEGKRGNAYLVLDNFTKIMQWNRSENYALAIGILADYVKDNRPCKPLAENPAVRLKTDDIITVQSFINRLFGSTLDEDGQLGSKTREAVKQVQKQAGLPPDGYPDYRLLEKIHRFNPKVGFAVPVPERKLHKRK